MIPIDGIIAPHMRRKGIASLLCKKVVEDAIIDGYNYVEAYPGTDDTNNHSYHGPLSIYEKNDFTLYKDLDGEVVVRKYL